MTLAKRIWRESGLKGFYKGYVAALCKHTVGFSCFLGTYELCRESFTDPGHAKDEAGRAFSNFGVECDFCDEVHALASPAEGWCSWEHRADRCTIIGLDNSGELMFR